MNTYRPDYGLHHLRRFAAERPDLSLTSALAQMAALDALGEFAASGTPVPPECAATLTRCGIPVPTPAERALMQQWAAGHAVALRTLRESYLLASADVPISEFDMRRTDALAGVLGEALRRRLGRVS